MTIRGVDASGLYKEKSAEQPSRSSKKIKPSIVGTDPTTKRSIQPLSRNSEKDGSKSGLTIIANKTATIPLSIENVVQKTSIPWDERRVYNEIIEASEFYGPCFRDSLIFFVRQNFKFFYQLYFNSYWGGVIGGVSEEGQSLPGRKLKILGAGDLRDEKLAKSELDNFGILTSNYHKGAILADKYWNIIKNDLMMVGALHAGDDFHLWTQRYSTHSGTLISMEDDKGNPRIDKCILTREGKLRVLSRELMMLYKSGYRFLNGHHPKLGLCLASFSPNAAEKITLREVCQSANNFTFRDILFFMNDNNKKMFTQVKPRAKLS